MQVAEALQTRSENDALPVWLRASTLGADEGAAMLPTLFPLPYPPGHPSLPAVCDRFRFLGRFVGKALQDRRVVSLPLSAHFLALVMGEPLPASKLPSVFRGLARVLDQVSGERVATRGKAVRSHERCALAAPAPVRAPPLGSRRPQPVGGGSREGAGRVGVRGWQPGGGVRPDVRGPRHSPRAVPWLATLPRALYGACHLTACAPRWPGAPCHRR